MTLPRFELTISFPSRHVKNRDYFAFLHKSSGHVPGHTSQNRDKSRKTGTYGHPSLFISIAMNQRV